MANPSEAGGGQVDGVAGERVAPHKTSSWVAVALIAVAAALFGFAFVLTSISLAIIAGVALVVGVAVGIGSNIMDDVH